MSQRAAGGLSSAPADSLSQRPAKAPKVDGSQSQAFSTTPASSAYAPRGRPSRQSGSSHRGGSKGFGLQKDKPQRNKKAVLTGPVQDEKYILETYGDPSRQLKNEWKTNPKSPLSNWYSALVNKLPRYDSKQLVGPSGMIWRYDD